MITYRVQIRKGLSSQREGLTFLEGEVHFDTDTEELRVGNSKGESVLVTKIVEGPHDKLLYAEVSDSPLFIPVCVRTK